MRRGIAAPVRDSFSGCPIPETRHKLACLRAGLIELAAPIHAPNKSEAERGSGRWPGGDAGEQ